MRPEMGDLGDAVLMKVKMGDRGDAVHTRDIVS
jgi:hypothetical protein